MFGPAPVRPRWRSTGRGRRPAQSLRDPDSTGRAFLSSARNDGTAVRGRKSHDAVAPRRRSAASALVFGQISPSQRTHASGPVPTRETGDSGDPEGTGRKTRQATTGDVHPSCEQAGLRPAAPTCEPRVRQCTRSDTGRAAGSAHAAAALDREEGQRVRPGWLISASPNRRILTRTQQGGRPGSCPCKSQAGETSTNWQGTKDILATMLDRPRSRGHEHNAYAAAREGHRQCGACILSIVHEGRYQRNPG